MDAASQSHLAATARAQATARRVHGVPAGSASAPRYAGLVTRAIAFSLDAALINAVAVLVGAAVALVVSLFPEPQERTELVVVGGVAFGIWMVGYFVAFWTATGQTPGDRVMRIAVVRENGSRLRPRHALARLVGIMLSLPLFVGFVPILFTERRRGLHDWLAGTVVTTVPDEPRSVTR
jgi:uncharacterized RDD family membrane protein YckC